MTLYTGSITGGGAAAVISKLEACLALESNWEFVEEYTTTKTFRIWKNKGHVWNNNRPFYIYMHVNSTNIGYIRVAEEWDPVLKKTTGGMTTTISGTTTLDALGRMGAENLQTVIAKSGVLTGVTDPTVQTYNFLITSAGMYLSTSANSDGIYLGLYEPSGVHSLTVEFPLICSLYSGSSPVVWFTRVPFLTGSQAVTYLEGTFSSDAAGTIPTGVALLNNKAVLSRRKVSSGGILRGFLPVEILTSAAPAAGVVTGDTITINENTYSYCVNNSNYNWLKVT